MLSIECMTCDILIWNVQYVRTLSVSVPCREVVHWSLSSEVHLVVSEVHILIFGKEVLADAIFLHSIVMCPVM